MAFFHADFNGGESYKKDIKLKEEIRDFAPPIPQTDEKQGPVVRLTPEEYKELEAMSEAKRPQWLAYNRWKRSHSPAGMNSRELFYAGYQEAVKFHKENK